MASKTNRPDEDAVEDVNSKRQRSPNFPAISLGKALDRAQQLFEKDKVHFVPVTVVHERWGYKALSGALMQTIAALKAYGLIEDMGAGKKRQIRISEIARKILLGHSEKTELIRDCAVKPRIFSQILSHFDQGIPADDILRHHLLFDYETPFNEDAVDLAIANFRETMEFAEFDDVDIIKPQDGGKVPQNPIQNPISKQPLPPAKDKMQNLTIPLSGGVLATLQVPTQISKLDYELLGDWIKLFGRTLVQPDVAPSDSLEP